MFYKILFIMCCLVIGFVCYSSETLAKSRETFHETYQVKSGQKLELYNRDGNVTIRQWSEDYVDVSAEKKALLGGKLSNVKVDVTIEGETFRIKTENLVRNPRVNVTYDIQIPAGLVVHYVQTSDGDVTLEGTQGATKIKTSDGNIIVRDVHGYLEARTSDGEIRVKGVDGNINVRTSDGDIDIHSVVGSVEARTSDGNVVIEKIDNAVNATTSDGKITIKNVDGIVEARTSDKDIVITDAASVRKALTSDGDISVELSASQAVDASIETNDGSIELFLSPELHLDLDLKASDGKIRLHEIEIVANEISRNRIKGRLGNGGKKLYVRTSDGHIDLFRLE